ncbi:MAG TPA: pilus assembly protein TadG-related protein [Gemmatimonadaceae bacterium]|nr:pilus assembly protein TadG-related protein [Gemmatimonadaceae bacterium]
MSEIESERLRLRNQRSRERGGRLPSNSRGAVLPLVAVSLVGVMSVTALAIDVGSLHRQRRTAQTAADAGATAGAHEIYREFPDSVELSAKTETARNGFAHGVNGVTVSVYNGPVTGFYIGDDQFVEVVISRPATTIFGGLLGRNSVTINVRGVAGIPAPSESCIYALEPFDEKALNVSGSQSRLDVSCGIVVNSSNSKAVVIESNGTLTGDSFAVTGGIDQSGGTVVISGTMETGVAPSPDPLAYLEPPSFDPAQCDYTNTKIASSTTAVLSPGIYCGGIEIDGTVAFNSGLYILRGGGLKSGSGVITGTGVTFFNTNATAANGGASGFKKFELGSGSRATLSAMTTGPLAGILFFQDPAAGEPGVVYENLIASGSNAVFTGTLYFPTQPIELGASTSTTTINGGVVATKVTVTSNSIVSVDMTGGLTGEPLIRRVSLVE